MKNEKGITLIALVITIIVLLILAGVSIAMLTGENGILNRANQSGAETKLSEAKEQVSLAINDLVADYYDKKYNGTSEITSTLGEYVAAQLPTQLAKAEYSDYATAVKSGNDAKVTLNVKDKDGKTLEATYSASTGKLGTFAAASSGS